MALLDNWHVVISRHEKGFWSADLFDGDSDEPSDFFTTRVGATRDAAVTMAARRWPHATISVVGACFDRDGTGIDDGGGQCCSCDGEGSIEIAAVNPPET